MNKKHTERIFNDFPEIFAGRDKPIPESLLLFGFECDDGWYDLVYNLCKKLKLLMDLTGVMVEAMQVKEKYGTLRFYAGMRTPPKLSPTGDFNEVLGEIIDDLINEAENRSAFICEVCGKTGCLCSSGYWYKTLCTSCRESNNYKKYTKYQNIKE